MAIDVAEEVRSEKPSLASVKQSLDAVTKSSSPDEMAELIMLAVELYTDGECRCEEKAAVFGDRSDEARSCNLSVKVTRDEMLGVFRKISQRLLKS